MRVYSLDLQERMIASREKNTQTRKLAKRFRVSKGTVSSLIKLKRETGSIKPKPLRCGKPGQLASKKAELRKMVEKYSDLTLAEYSEHLD